MRPKFGLSGVRPAWQFGRINQYPILDRILYRRIESPRSTCFVLSVELDQIIGSVETLCFTYMNHNMENDN